MLLALISHKWITDIPFYRWVKIWKSKVKQPVCGHTTRLWQCRTDLSVSQASPISPCRWSCMHSTCGGYCMFTCVSKCILVVCSAAHLYMSPSITADQGCRLIREVLTHESVYLWKLPPPRTVLQMWTSRAKSCTGGTGQGFPDISSVVSPEPQCVLGSFSMASIRQRACKVA